LPDADLSMINCRTPAVFRRIGEGTFMSIHPTALQILEIVEKGGYTTAGGKWVDVRAL